MSEVPEEVVVTIEADDRATPKITSFSRSLILLGSNIAYVTRAFGVQNTAVDQMLQALLTVGHMVRAVSAAKATLAAVTQFLTAVESQNLAVKSASIATDTAKTVSTGILTGAVYQLTGAFVALNAAMGPVGWAIIGAGAIAGLAAGAYMGGAFSGGGVRGGVLTPGGKVPEGVSVNINIGAASFRKKGDAEEEVKSIGNLFHKQFRGYRL